MDEKKPEQAQKLDDQQLTDVSGGARVMAASIEDESRDTSVFSSAARLSSANNTELGAAARCAATSDDEELVGWGIHVPPLQ